MRALVVLLSVLWVTQNIAEGRGSCPPSNSFGRQCLLYRDQCTSSAICNHGQACCLVAGCGRECVDVATDPRCPDPNSFGLQCFAYIDQCKTSAECSQKQPGHSCCLVGGCGHQCMDVSKSTQPTDPRCPASNSYGRQCFQYYDQCKSTSDCRYRPGHACCLVGGCGHECVDVSKPTQQTGGTCPEPWVYGIRCSGYIDECKSIVDCRHKPGTNCCLVSGCGHKCMDISRYTTNPINVPQPVPFRG